MLKQAKHALLLQTEPQSKGKGKKQYRDTAFYLITSGLLTFFSIAEIQLYQNNYPVTTVCTSNTGGCSRCFLTAH